MPPPRGPCAVILPIGEFHPVGPVALGDGQVQPGAGFAAGAGLAMRSSGVAGPSDSPASSSTPTTRPACGSTTSLTVLPDSS